MSVRRICLLLLGWAVVACLLTPLAFAAWVSFSPGSFLTPPTGEWSGRWYLAFAEDRRWTAALVRSLVVGVASAAVAVVAGTPLALAVARYRFGGNGLLAGAALLPLCVPPAVLGMGILPLLYAAGLWGNLLGLVLAHGLVGFPLVYLIARSHFAQTSSDLEAAARGLGAGPWQTAVRVTLPLARPAVLAGAAAAFAVSLNESMLTVFLATPTTETVPAVVWPQLRYSPSPLVAVASCVSVGVALIVAVAFVVGRRLSTFLHQCGEEVPSAGKAVWTRTDNN
jgi:ABC-type spermidine/putrescine transport system permease subunit II